MSIFIELSIIIVIATLIAAVMHILRQPLIISYILTGLVVGPSLLNILQTTEVLNVFSEIGIALLLFIVGLGLNPKLIKEVGFVSLITGTGQVIFTALVGFIITLALGFPPVAAIYIAIALTFSSTIIIVKLLSDKGDMQKLYGKIALGFLLVQDVIATLILIGMSAFSVGNNLSEVVISISLKGFVLIAAAIVVSHYLLPRLSAFFASSQEFLFLFSIAWGLGLASAFHLYGFSIEIGALVAGISLSISPYQLEISAKMKPLRDFFIVLFFILLGSKMTLGAVGALIIPAIILSLFVLIGNPIIVMIIMGLMGYNKKVSFFAGLTVAQISEFSLIIILLGVKLGAIPAPDEVLSLVTMIGLVTIAISTYLILYADRIYPLLSKILIIFERKKARQTIDKPKRYDIMLFGHNRIGYDFLKSFNKLKKKHLVIDFDPKIIAYLKRQNIDCHYGDADDMEFLDELGLDKVRLVVSTIPEFKTNLLLVRRVRQNNKNAIIIIISHNIAEAEKLYEHGASYVVLPHFLGGQHTAEMIEKFGLKRGAYNQERSRHLEYLQVRKNIGHEHPVRESER
ncbi:MAG: cation:proton antiporter [bacterium]|nr:cation:proton antiporter [bacterium]